MLYERDNGSHNVYNNNLWINPRQPHALNYAYLKTNYKKMKIKHFKLKSAPQGAAMSLGENNVSYQYVKTFKLRIMKNCEIITSSANTITLSIPDIHLIYFYHPGDGATNNSISSLLNVTGPNPLKMNCILNMTYTDV